MKEKILLSALFVLIANLFFYSITLGVVGGFVFLSLAGFFFLTRTKDNQNLSLALSAAVLSIIFGFLCGGRANELVVLINFVSAFFFSIIALFYFKDRETFPFTISSLLIIPLSLIKNIVLSLFPKQAETLNTQPLASEEVEPTPFVKGLIIATPLFFILAFLLVQADPIFGAIGQQVLSQLGSRALFSVVIFILLLVLAITKIRDRLRSTKQEINQEVSQSKSLEFRVVLISIILLFTAFILVQLRYLFVSPSEIDLKSLGIDVLTYSDYVRRGFFELLIASAISSFIIIYVLRFLHQLHKSHKTLMQLLTGVLTIETLLLLLSAVKRLSLYEMAHGLTRARIFGFIFLVWLAALLIIFLIRVIKNIKEEYSFISIVSVSLIALLLINIVNIDGIIAADFRPTVNGEVDYFYLASLSPDAAQSWPDIINPMSNEMTIMSAKPGLSADDGRKLYLIGLTLNQLNSRVNYLTEKYGPLNRSEEKPSSDRNWQSFNLSEYLAYVSNIKNKDISGVISNLLKEQSVLESKLSQEDQQNIQIDRDVNPPLVSHPSNEAL